MSILVIRDGIADLGERSLACLNSTSPMQLGTLPQRDTLAGEADVHQTRRKGAPMKEYETSKTWVRSFTTILFLGIFLCGCGREQTVSPVPIVVSTTPANGATAVPVAQVISATFNQAMDPTTINASTFLVTGPGAVMVTGVVTFSGTTASFTPNALLAPSAQYTATITTGAANPAGNPLAANVVWTFTTGTIPTVTATNPANGAMAVPINQKITATFSEAMNPSTITAAGTFTLAVAGGGAAVTGTVTYVAATNTAMFAPTGNLLPSTQYTATITTAAQSAAAGNGLASNFVWSFTTGLTADLTAPTIIFTNPASGDGSVPTNQKIIATFSKPMDSSTVTAAGTFTVAVAGAGGANVPGTVSYAGNSATFTPSAALTPSTDYTATITNAALDLSGNALVAGAVPNPWNFTTSAGPDTTAPTITLTSPASGAMSVSLNTVVSATFSKDMDPLTITAPGTFTVAVAGGGAAVTGTVTYDAVNDIATFTPAANLTPSTQYTATITNAATDLAGNALAAGVVPNPWSFTTGLVVGPVGPNLGTASTFGSIGGGAGITNQGINTVINGDIGTTGASTLVTGFHDAGVGCTYTETGSNIGFVNGNIDTAPPPPTVGCPNEGTLVTAAIATQALADANTAYINLSPASRPGGTDPGAGQLGGLTLAPGIYQAAAGSFLITGSDLTLDAQGDTNAVWVFQMASTLTVGAAGAPRNVILTNGAQAKNVFWQVGSMATINGAGGGTMVGTIIASTGVSFSTAGNAAITTLNGRALALNASVTMVNTVINVPAP